MTPKGYKPPRPRLSRGDDDFLVLLAGFLALQGRMPTFRYLQTHLVWSRAKVQRSLDRLEERGYLRQHPSGTIKATLIHKDQP